MRLFAVLALAGCYPAHEPPGDDPTMFFRMDETGDGPRIDPFTSVGVYPWKRLGFGVYHQDGIGTTAVPAIVGNGQHIDGAGGYHFAAASTPAMDHGGDNFTWAGWASIDPGDTYLDHQTLLAKWTGVPDTEVPGDRREYRVWFDPAVSRWQFEVSADGLEGAGHSIVVTHPTVIERDRMYFIEAWHDADSRTVNLRVSDQVARGAVESAGWDQRVFASPADLDVGAQNACSEHHLQGTIDALGYWNRTLSEPESTALWNDGNGFEPQYAAIVPFALPHDLIFNTQKLADPEQFARDHDAVSWLYLNGAEFNTMEGGMSYDQVQRAVGRSLNVITDPPRVLDLELARQHVAALDELPRPTLVTCRAGPRSSAVSYMYAGLRAGAEPDEVLAAAESAGAPFCKFDDYKAWVVESITALRREGR